MSIELQGKDLFPYLGDRRPISFYHGDVFIAGYEWSEATGQEAKFTNTYNDQVEAEILTPSNSLDLVSSVGGRNLVISSGVTPAHRVQSDGSIIFTIGHFITDYIEVKVDEVYTITMLLQSLEYSRIAYYDLDKNFIKRDLFQHQEITQIKPEKDGFIRWSPDVDTLIDDYVPGYKIEKGSTSTDWTPAPEDIPYNELVDGVYKTKTDNTSGKVYKLPSFYGHPTFVFPAVNGSNDTTGQPTPNIRARTKTRKLKTLRISTDGGATWEDYGRPTEVMDYRFAWHGITHVEIPDSVTHIGKFSFAYNEIESLHIPKSVKTIGDTAFDTNNLTYVEFPETLESIGVTAFNNNPDLTWVRISSRTSYMNFGQHGHDASFPGTTNITIY